VKEKDKSSPLALGNVRQLGVRGLILSCVNPQCGHELVFSADDLPDDIEVPSSAAGAVCDKCGGVVEMRPNWNEMSIAPPTPGAID
jgi:hypothetical protein